MGPTRPSGDRIITHNTTANQCIQKNDRNYHVQANIWHTCLQTWPEPKNCFSPPIHCTQKPSSRPMISLKNARSGKFSFFTEIDNQSSRKSGYFSSSADSLRVIEIFPSHRPKICTGPIGWRLNEPSIYQNGDRSPSTLKKMQVCSRIY